MRTMTSHSMHPFLAIKQCENITQDKDVQCSRNLPAKFAGSIV